MTHVFGHVLTILARTKCRLVTKHILSITNFPSCYFLTFPFKFYFYKKFKLSIKDYLLLIYTFISTDCPELIWYLFPWYFIKIFNQLTLLFSWKRYILVTWFNFICSGDRYFSKILIFVSPRGKCTQKLRNSNISGDGRGQIHLLS